MKNKIITSEGNIQFQYGDGSGRIINVHPFHVYTNFNEDTVSFILIAMPKSSGLAIFTTKAEDLELNGTTYSFAQLPNKIAEEFAIAGAQARAEIVSELPVTGKTNTIYLVPIVDASGSINHYDEYIYVKAEQRWELLGDTSIELSRYVKKTDFNSYTAQTESKINTISGVTDTKLAISDFNAYSGAVDTRLDDIEDEIQEISGNSVDISAFTAHTSDASIHVTSAEKAIWNAKQDALVAGDNITISGNVISATGGGSTFDLPISAGTGNGSIIQGNRTTASGQYSHAEGYFTKANGSYSHAEGYSTTAGGMNSHAEGTFTSANGSASHAEGNNTYASGAYSHAEGGHTSTNNDYEHASGQFNISSSASTTFGDSGNTLFSVGNGNSNNARHNVIDIRQNGDIYIADTNDTSTSNYYEKPMIKLQDALAQGGGNQSGFEQFTNPTSFSKTGLVNSLSQYYDTNIGKGAVIEGDGADATAMTVASGDFSHAEGQSTKASGTYSHAEGNSTTASGTYSHAEGYNTKASGMYSHAEGHSATASGSFCHAEGSSTRAIGQDSHAEGLSTTASGMCSHAEGQGTTANGSYSHAEGNSTTASGAYSHAEGYNTKANSQSEHASGQFNISSSASTTFGNSGNTLFSVGNGLFDTESVGLKKHNSFEIKQNGDIYIADTNASGEFYEKPMIKLQDALDSPTMTVESIGHKLADYTDESFQVQSPYEKNGVVWASYDSYDMKLNFGGMGGRHLIAPFSTDYGTNCYFYLSDESPIYSITFVMRTDTISTMKNSISTAVTAAYDVYDGVPSDAEITIPTGTSGYEWGAVTYQLKSGATPLTAITTDYVDSYLRIAEIYMQYMAEVKVPIADKVNELNAKLDELSADVATKAEASDLGGLKLVRISQSGYDALATKDSNTLYIIIG